MSSPVEQNAVLLISEPVVPGGIGIYTANLLRGLTLAGIEHPTISNRKPVGGILPEDDANQVEVLDSLFRPLWWPLIRSRLEGWAREREAGLIHGMSAVTAPLCAKLAARLKIPYIVTVHHYQKKGAIPPDPWLKAVVTVSDALREHLVNDAGLSKELVRLIPAGIDVPRELPARPVEYAQDAESSIPLVSCFSKLVPRKDCACFLRAIRRVLDTLGHECSFVLAGDGPEEPALRKLVKELQIERNVTFCHGAIRYDELLRDTDVYVQCSKVEGFGTMVLQAMAHGVPVVATATGGLLSLVQDSETGYLVPVGDSEALAARIVNLLNDAELSHRFGEAGRQMALTQYTLERMMEKTLEIYTEARGVPVGA